MTVDDANHAWLDDLFASIDEMATDRFLRFRTDNGNHLFSPHVALMYTRGAGVQELAIEKLATKAEGR